MHGALLAMHDLLYRIFEGNANRAAQPGSQPQRQGLGDVRFGESEEGARGASGPDAPEPGVAEPPAPGDFGVPAVDDLACAEFVLDEAGADRAAGAPSRFSRTS